MMLTGWILLVYSLITGSNVIKSRGFFYIYFIYNFFNFIRCYMLEFNIFLHIHMIFNFHYTRVSSGVIYNVFPNFICNCREESFKLFRNFTCIIYNFIVFLQNYILIPRVTFFREKWFNSFPEVDIFSPTRTAFKKISFHRILF